MKDLQSIDSAFWRTIQLDAARVGCHIDIERPIRRLFQTRRFMSRKQGFACVFWLRVNQLFVDKGWWGQFRLRRWRRYRFANHISPFARIGPGLAIPHPADITIGGSAFIGANATIFNGVTIVDLETPNCPTIGDNVTIYTGAKIIKGVKIGSNVTVGALTLINKPIPSNCTVYGIPPNQTIVSSTSPGRTDLATEIRHDSD